MTRSDAERWYAELSREPYGWVIDAGGRCVGVGRLHHVDTTAGAASLALGLFAPADRGRGFGSETVRLLLGFGFGVLGLVHVRLRVLAFNAPALACYHRYGFREVARERASVDGDETEDVLMELTAAEFRRMEGGASGRTGQAAGLKEES